MYVCFFSSRIQKRCHCLTTITHKSTWDDDSPRGALRRVSTQAVCSSSRNPPKRAVTHSRYLTRSLNFRTADTRRYRVRRQNSQEVRHHHTVFRNLTLSVVHQEPPPGSHRHDRHRFRGTRYVTESRGQSGEASTDAHDIVCEQKPDMIRYGRRKRAALARGPCHIRHYPPNVPFPAPHRLGRREPVSHFPPTHTYRVVYSTRYTSGSG